MFLGPRLRLVVAGKPLRQFGAWSDLTYSFARDGGCKEASWTMGARYGARLPLLRRGALVEVFWGGLRVWSGYLTDPDWNGDEVTLTAAGAFRLGEDYYALTSTNIPTSNPAEAIFNATGIGWSIDPSVPNVPLPGEAGDAPQRINKIKDVMDAHAQRLGLAWGVTEDFVAYMTAPLPGPSYFIRSGAGDLGIASDNYASHVIVWHYSSDAGDTARAAVYPSPLRGGTPNAYEATYGHAETGLDILDRGPISNADADALAKSVYEQTTQRPGWTNGLTLGRGQIINPGGRPVDPASVRPNRVARLLGVPDEVAMTNYTDFVIGETSYRDGDDTVSITPVGLVSRTQEDVLTELLEAMSAA